MQWCCDVLLMSCQMTAGDQLTMHHGQVPDLARAGTTLTAWKQVEEVKYQRHGHF